MLSIEEDKHAARDGEVVTHLKKVEEISATSGSRTTIELVYEALRRAILCGEIPPESRMRVEDLRATFGVGSSTVREALSRLLAENLVTTEGQRGFRAATISIEDFKSIVEMRALLEARAVRHSIETGDDDWESAFVAAHHRLAKLETDAVGHEDELVSDWEKRNRAFHDAMTAACTNVWLLNCRSMLYSHSVRYLQISFAQKRCIPRDVRAEHQAIFEAVIDRDAERAEKLTADHIFRTVPEIEARLAEMKLTA